MNAEKAALAPAPSARIDVLDGLRGVAIILVFLSHHYYLWSPITADSNPVEASLLDSGNYAVSIFFAVGAFLYTRSLVRRRDSSELGLNPPVVIARRYLRLTGQITVLLLVLALVSNVESDGDTYPGTDLLASSLRVLTHTWNWFVLDQAMLARPDLGHLWYISVDMQVFLGVLALTYLLRRRARTLVVTLLALLVICWAWRHHVLVTEGEIRGLLRTTTRADAALAGAVIGAATATTWLDPLRPYVRAILLFAVAALVPLTWFNLDEARHLGVGGMALDLTLMAFIVSVTLVTDIPAAIRHTLGSRPLAFLGRRSLGIYVWHFPVFAHVSIHGQDWESWQRVAVAWPLALALATASELLVESQVRRLLNASFWGRFDTPSDDLRPPETVDFSDAWSASDRSAP